MCVDDGKLLVYLINTFVKAFACLAKLHSRFLRNIRNVTIQSGRHHHHQPAAAGGAIVLAGSGASCTKSASE